VNGTEQARVLAAERPKLWELDEKYFCPVVGTCLPIEELRKLARREGLAAATASDFDVHVAAVNCCKGRNAFSRLLHKLLERRHAAWVARFARASTEGEAASLWNEALAEGQAAGALWGALTCRAATPGLRHAAYEDIHMLSHQVGAGVRADLRRVAALEDEIADLKARIERAGRRHEAELAGRARRIAALERVLGDARAAQAEAHELKRRLAELSCGRRQAELEERAARLEREAARAAALQDRLARAEADNGRLAAALAQAEAERGALEGWIAEAAGRENGAGGGPPSFAGRRLLCVGGRLNLYAQYRLLVERAGGALEIHDGGREEAFSRLAPLLARADAVICPADCVSHPAYYAVKRHCKLTGKPCVLLRNSGVASFAEGLRRLAEGRAQIGPSPAP
jgi:hypothetical protein